LPQIVLESTPVVADYIMAAVESALDVRVTSSTRVFAATRLDRTTTSHSISLSIIDATVADFAPCAAVWFFDSPPSPHSAPSPSHLRSALEKTLNAYPQWCGRLHRVSYRRDGHHTQRFGRLNLTYGLESDPGVEFVVAQSPTTLSSLVPSAIERSVRFQSWNASRVPSEKFLPSTPLALSKIDDARLPGMVVQITTFGCGGMAVAVKIAHPLADAHALVYFARDWARASCAILADKPMPSMSPVFNPHLLDRSAAGDIDALQPDPALIEMARALPCHRFDWWASVDGCPFPTQATKIPPELNPASIGSPGTRMPWSDWDLAAPVSHYLLHFSSSEVKHVWEMASLSSAPVSRHDALVSHIWACINRARGLEHDEETVHLDISFGLRSRLSPALPDAFLGSPVMLADVSSSGREASMESPAAMASRIRSTLARFNSSTLSAHLHDAAYEASPQRLWQAFLGRRHVLVTSWVHSRVYEVDFGTALPPRYVEAVMPSMDGCVQLMEAAPVESSKEVLGSSRDLKKLNHWCDNGVDVSIHLESKAMERLLKDPLLRKYSSG